MEPTSKLKLDIEALQVESFEPEEGLEEPRGTVFARQDCSAYNSCWCATGEARCDATVPFTDDSCQSNIIACPAHYSDASCGGYSCYDSDGPSCTFRNTQDRTCWYC